MQRARAILVAWLGSGSCQNWPKGWILINQSIFCHYCDAEYYWHAVHYGWLISHILYYQCIKLFYWKEHVTLRNNSHIYTHTETERWGEGGRDRQRERESLHTTKVNTALVSYSMPLINFLSFSSVSSIILLCSLKGKVVIIFLCWQSMNTQVLSHTTGIRVHILQICRRQVTPMPLYVTWSINMQSVITNVHWYVTGY
jgi:hypothetical protein